MYIRVILNINTLPRAYPENTIDGKNGVVYENWELCNSKKSMISKV